MKLNPNKIAVLGSGSWGATLAFLFACDMNQQVSLWGRSADKLAQIQKTHCFTHPAKLPLLPNVSLSTDLQAVCRDSQLIVSAIPSEGTHSLIEQLAALQISPQRILSATKGLDPSTQRTMSQLWSDYYGGQAQIGALSGPNLSEEASQLKPMKTTIACVAGSEDLLPFIQSSLESVHSFKMESVSDIVGLELCATAKNVIALAAGAWDGLGLGTSGKGCLLTRAICEISDFVVMMGGHANTIHSVGGIGDLFITCSSLLSRNYRTGFLLAQGHSLEQIRAQLEGQVAEGVAAATLIHRLSSDRQHKLSICELVYKLLRMDLQDAKMQQRLAQNFLDII